MKYKLVMGIYNDKPTMLINNRIINGCQDFTIDQLDQVQHEYNLSQHVVDTVCDHYYSPDNWQDATQYGQQHYLGPLDHINTFALCCLAKHGTSEIQSLLIQNTDAHATNIRRNVAQYGNDTHRSSLINDPDNITRSLVVQYGNDHHRDQLIQSSDLHVQITIARYGNDHHRNHLLNNTPQYMVKYLIAQYGNNHHRDQLINDRSNSIRSQVAQYGNATHKQILINDDATFVRIAARAQS